MLQTHQSVEDWLVVDKITGNFPLNHPEEVMDA
jgi:hypothetical protein